MKNTKGKRKELNIGENLVGNDDRLIVVIGKVGNHYLYREKDNTLVFARTFAEMSAGFSRPVIKRKILNPNPKR